MKTTHTPGPWEIEFSNSLRKEHLITAGKRGFVIAETTNFMQITDLTMQQAEANERLIAAAPELLEALITLKHSFIHTEGNKKGNQAKSDIIKYNDDVREALNKARIALDKIGHV